MKTLKMLILFLVLILMGVNAHAATWSVYIDSTGQLRVGELDGITLGSGTGPVVLTFSVTGTDPTLTVDTNGFTFSAPITTGASASPTYILKDSDAPDAGDQQVASWKGQYVSGASGAENTTSTFTAREAGVDTDYFQLDGVNARINVYKPLLATGIVDGTSPITITPTSSDYQVGAVYKSGYVFISPISASAANSAILPAASTANLGSQYCVGNDSGKTGTLTVKTKTGVGNQYLDLDGTLTANTGNVSATAAAGNLGCAVCISSTVWKWIPTKGTWSRGP